MSQASQAKILLLILAVLCVGNLNGIAYMVAGVSQAFSVLIGLTAAAMFAKFMKSIPSFGWYTSIFIAAFLLLSLLFSSLYSDTTDWRFVLGPWGFGLIMLATSGATASLSDIQFSRLLRGLCWLLSLISLATVSSPYLLAFYKIVPLDSLRSSGVFLNPNTAAVIANIGFALCLSYYFDTRRRAYLLLALISATAVFVTFSKTGFVTLCFLTALTLVSATRGRRRQAVLTVLVAVAFGSLAFVFWVPDLHDLQLDRLNAAGRILLADLDEELSTGRTIVWNVAAGQIAENGLISGAGLGSMRAIEGGIFQRGAWQGAHNFWLVLVGESGLIPAIMFALLLLALALRSISLQTTRYFAVAYIAVLAADTMAAHHIFEMRYHAFFLGLVIGIAFAKRTDGQRLRPDVRAWPRSATLPSATNLNY